MPRAGASISRRIWIGLAALLILAVVTTAILWRVSRERCFVLVESVTCRVETRAPLVALTFDDGPTPLGVERVLPELERHGARATFFLTGGDADAHPELVRAIVSAGHDVGNHSYTHRRMVGRGMGFYDSEIARTQAALSRAGADSRTFRPPYGKKLIGLPIAVRRAGLQMIMWDVEDPPTSDPAAFASAVVASARPGSIILVHAMYPANETARDALPLILDGLAAKGLKAVTVRELIEHGQPAARPQ